MEKSAQEMLINTMLFGSFFIYCLLPARAHSAVMSVFLARYRRSPLLVTTPVRPAGGRVTVRLFGPKSHFGREFTSEKNL